MKKGLIFREIGVIVIGVIEQTNKTEEKKAGSFSAAAGSTDNEAPAGKCGADGRQL